MSCIIALILTLVSNAPTDTNPVSADRPIIVQNYYWAKEGKIQEVYEHRKYACEVRKNLGFAVGRVLLRKDSQGGLAHVIWECEFPSEAARQEDIRLLSESGAFEEVMEKMGTLIDKFDRATYYID